MATEFVFVLEDSPGELGKIAEVLSKAGINIDGLSGIGAEGKALIRIVTHQISETISALDEAAIPFKTNEVLILNLADKPGALARLTKPFTESGVNLTTFYMTTGRQQVIGVDNLEKAKEIASQLDVLAETINAPSAT